MTEHDNDRSNYVPNHRLTRLAWVTGQCDEQIMEEIEDNDAVTRSINLDFFSKESRHYGTNPCNNTILEDGQQCIIIHNLLFDNAKVFVVAFEEKFVMWPGQWDCRFEIIQRDLIMRDWQLHQIWCLFIIHMIHNSGLLWRR